MTALVNQPILCLKVKGIRQLRALYNSTPTSLVEICQPQLLGTLALALRLNRKVSWIWKILGMGPHCF